ncbi:MAG: Antitoxin HipB [Chlamydiae bacterium]|nr:Antitoxin HipB [Chlamydiota bacterium]
MKRSASEKILIEEVASIAKKMEGEIKGLSIGDMIKLIRTQLGMSQKILAKRASVPQSTISRIEKGKTDANLSTLHKILHALSCHLVIVPILDESIDVIRRKQAREKAEKHVRYLKGTMSLEEQHMDFRLSEELLKQEEDQFLHDPHSKLWEE